MRLFAALLVLAAPQAPPGSGPLRLPCIADTQLSTSRGEEGLNGGGRSTLRLKGIEDFTIADFDVEILKGRSVLEARLFVFPAGAQMLRSIGISTIGTPWKEGSGTNSPAQPGECTFLEAAHGERPWGGPGSDFHAVTFGRGGSIWFARDLRAEPDGWASVEIPPPILHAMAERNSFGLALSDEESQTMHNNSIYSREQSGKAPYISVLRWQEGAPPASGARAFVLAAKAEPADRSGEILRRSGSPGPAPSPASLGDARYRILYEGETNPSAAPARRLWDGRSVTLPAARGEHVGFEIAVELARPSKVRLEGAGWTASRVLPVGSTYDPLVPVEGECSGPALFHVERYVPKTAPTGEQKVPLVLRIGELEAAIPVALWVHAAVLPDALSFQISLNAYGSPGGCLGEGPGAPGFLELEHSFHRLAHEHRATLAIVPYSHRGHLQWATAPEIRRSGSDVEVTSWALFDERYGPYLDGTAFKGLPRDGVPLAHLYWPMHENWPLPINDYYSYHGKPEDHWRDAPPPEQAFAEPYGKAFGSMVRAFGAHAAARGWTRTQFQVFLNNKPDVRFQRHQPEGSWWRLDEPVSAEDHQALRYFGARAVDAVRDLPSVKIRFRADLSRPQCLRNYLDGILGLAVVAGSYRRYPDLVFGRGAEVWIYGSVPIGGSGEAGRAWTLQCFLDGADGVVPWLALGEAGAWEKPEDTALLLPPRPGMERRAYPTLRLKGLRRGEQDAELLRLVLTRLKASRAEVRTGLARALGLAGNFKKTSEEDAGTVDYGHLDPDRFEAVRQALLEALDP